MPQSKERHAEWMRERRGAQTQGAQPEGAQNYPAILHSLTDPEKRKKLEKITQSLKEFKQEKNVRYGVNGPTFDIVGELLEATRN